MGTQNQTATSTPANAVDEAQMTVCLQVLAWLAENPSEADELPQLGSAVARAYKRVRKQRRIIAARAREAASSRSRPASAAKRICYICRNWFQELDAAYPLLCSACAAHNLEHRNKRADLTGRKALVTGARIKVGYQLALKMLRDGAEVIATTRFAKDAARRYAAEPDFDQWRDRLRLHSLDLRNLPAVQAFAHCLRESMDGLDILINNAAQTIRRPPGFYQSLLTLESQPLKALPEAQRALLASDSGPLHGTAIQNLPTLPAAELPFRSTWLLPMEEVESLELAEVMVINAMAPFLLCSQLEPLMRRSRFADRYIVNVTSAEGQFERADKTFEHPHTNMAKASLNMLTRTAAARCAEFGIYMNSVDPGWITHMAQVNPAAPEEDSPASAFAPPLDAVDGAARIYDPIIRGVEGAPVRGLLLKDYQAAPW